MIRLSFIVPFYNVEPYIEECIRSLYDQDIPQEEYEVICVDDWSPDGSRAIVERLENEYPTLRLLVHTENKRQGGARNTGLREARGRYIWFVDSDDTIQKNCIGSMLRKAEEDQLDLLKFHFIREGEIPSKQLLSTNRVMTGTELIFDVECETSLLSRCNSAVQQLIRRDYLIESTLQFAERVQYEDDDFAYQLYAYAKRVYLISKTPYIIRQTPESTTRRQNDVQRIRDIYAQALRMAKLDAKLTQQDNRWHTMVYECIKDCINNCVFRMLKEQTTREQLYFWYEDRKQVNQLKPYLSHKSYMKLHSYVLWRLLQK